MVSTRQGKHAISVIKNTDLVLDDSGTLNYQFGMNRTQKSKSVQKKASDEGKFPNFLREYRLRAKLKQWELAEQAGTKQPTIVKFEKGQRKLTTQWAERFAPLLKISVRDLLFVDPSKIATLGETAASDESVRRPVTHSDPSTSMPRIIPSSELYAGEPDLPVYASVQGGRGLLIVSTEAVDWVRRPDPLARVKDGYGLIVQGDSMSPEFESGDIALVHPHLPPRPDVSCVFYSEKPDGSVEASIKRLRKETQESWLVTQFNPPDGGKRDFTLPKSEWQKCHITVGKYSRR